VWWLRLGIGIERIKPGNPQQNGRHERMHLTLKKEATKPAAKNLLQQQAKFDHFIDYYNEERLHATLGYMTPATWHRGQPDEVRDERARRIAAARAHRRMTNQQRFTEAA
jgi:transposase InsO family protein